MKKKVILIGVLLLLVVTVIGVSYAAFSYSQTGAYENTITTGEIGMSYDETSKVINMSGALPTTDETGKASLVEGEYFDFSVTTHIVGDTNINWEISAKALDSNTFDESNVRLYLTKIVDGEEVQVMAPTNYSENSTSNSYTGRPANEMSLLMGSTSQQGDITTNYRLRMWVDEDYNPQGDIAGKTFAVEVNVYGKQGNTLPSATDTLLAKANDISITNYTDGNTSEMYTFTHEAGAQQSGWTEEELTDYRYIGSSPNNYLIFNGEIWRIIGVFTVQDNIGARDQHLKLIKEENIGSQNVGETLFGNNDLSNYLNNNYLNDIDDSQISSIDWYVSSITSVGSADTLFALERNDVWNGKIGLIYPSDLLFTFGKGINNNCYNNTVMQCPSPSSLSWLGSYFNYYAFINSTYDSSKGGLLVALHYGYIGRYPITSTAVRSAIYLNSDVSIAGGTGTEQDPYTLVVNG